MNDITLSAEEARVGTVLDYRNGIMLRITELHHEDGIADYEALAHDAVNTAGQILAGIEGTPLALMKLIQVILYLSQETPNMQITTLAELLWQLLNWQCHLVAMRSQTGPFNEATFPSTAVTFPATTETVSVQRDENGFIESATKIRQPIG